MDKRIDDLKKYYIETPVPVEIQAGLADVLTRLEKDKSQPFYHSRILLFALLFLLVTGSFFGVALSSSPSSPLYSFKEATIKTINTLDIPLIKFEIKKSGTNALKNALPTPKPTTQPAKPSTYPSTKPTDMPNRGSSQSKQNENSQSNNEKVKGASTKKIPTSAPQQQINPSIAPGNSGENRNNNSQNNSNSTESEKSNNGKSK